MNRLASKKLVALLVAVAAVALNKRLGLGLTEQDISELISLASIAIGVQGAIDIAPTIVRKKDKP